MVFYDRFESLVGVLSNPAIPSAARTPTPARRQPNRLAHFVQVFRTFDIW
jgi:hypothetical protein